MHNKHDQKQWWAPVWTGLVIDKKGTHCKTVKSAIWLYLYFLLNADRKTGRLMRKVTTICEDTGISERTIRRWLATLAGQKYIELRFTGRCLHIQIRKWKGTGLQNMASQSGQQWQGSVAKSGKSEEAPKTENLLDSCGETHFPSIANDISIKRYIIKNDIDRKTQSVFSVADCVPQAKARLLAIYLSQELNDRKGFPLYLAYSKKYPESLLKQVLVEVKAIPDGKIRKSRGALFNHLIQKYAQKLFKHAY
jgi:hypothetical protein